MTDRELLEALHNDMQIMKDDMQTMKGDMQVMKGDMQSMKGDMQAMKGDMQVMKDDMQAMKDDMQALEQKTTMIEMSLENETNHNIQLLAENHMQLVDKLNQAIRVQDKSLLYEVQISGLKSRIDLIEREIAEIKSQIA